MSISYSRLRYTGADGVYLVTRRTKRFFSSREERVKIRNSKGVWVQADNGKTLSMPWLIDDLLVIAIVDKGLAELNRR